MKAGLKARARAFFRRHFPERQIYLRSHGHGRVQFVVLTPVQQGIMASMLLVVLGWLAYSSVSTVFHREIVASLEGRIADLKSAHEAEMARARFDYEELNATLTLAEERFGQMTAALEARQRDLETTFAQVEAADATLESVRARLARVALFDLGGGRDAPAHEALPEEEAAPADGTEAAPDADPVTDTSAEGTGGPETDNASDDAAVPVPAPAPTAVEEDHSEAAPDSDAPISRMASSGTSATVQLNAPPSGMRSVAFARAASKSYLGRRLAAIDGRLMDLEDDQASLAAAMRNAIDEKVERTLSAFELTDVNVAKLVPPGQTQIGGPFIPADGITLADLPLQGVGAQAQFDMLGASMARFDRMNEVLLSTPLALPLRAHTSLSSGFGTRSDPFSRRSAFHAGLDFRGQYGTPIHATAPGRVLTAERRGPYGLMVEIDHGNGIRTRYGHMQSLAVSAGQEIAFGQIVGTLGSTGRSTGPHLHYEVWYEGAARNPVSFLKAGQHVFER